jgi:GT2 family glycosyltransferase
MRKLDVIIPHLNYEHLDECLETLHRNTPVLGKVILIDQNPIYKDYGKLVDIHLRTDNLGYAKACNTGMRLADAEYVMCCNDDVRFINKKWWQGIEDAFATDDKIVLLNPSTYRDPIAETGVVVTTPGLEKYEHEDMPDEVYDRMVCDYWHTGGFCMFAPIFKSSLMNKIKGVVPCKAWFNEISRYGGGEDYMMQWHIGRSGLKSYSVGMSWVFHWWYQTKHPLHGQTGAKYDSSWLDIYSKKDENGNILDTPDTQGESGRDDVPTVIIRD